MQRPVISTLAPKKLHIHRELCYFVSPAPAPAPAPASSSQDEGEVLSRLIDACSLSQDIRTAKETQCRVIRFGYGADPYIASSLVSTYARCNRIDLCSCVLLQLVGMTSDMFVVNLMLSNLLGKGEYVVARNLFDRLPARDVVTWNTMIGGYVKNMRYEESVRLFRAMVKSGVELNKFTFASAMAGCARLGVYDRARGVHGLLVQRGIGLNSILSAALIDMYAKCGRIEIAREIFDMVDREEVSVWNSMIHGLALHGRVADAVTMFSRMETENVTPDGITYVGILTALNHGGLVEEGRKFFDQMINGHMIPPEIEHYGTMVDLLGRGGCLDEAYDLIQKMSMKPDIIVWRAFLSACRSFKRLDLGEVAIANISRLRSGDYVLLSNMLCSQARWDDAEEVRETMMKNAVRKVQGKSWLEVGGVVHRFRAGEESHPQAAAVYATLKILIVKARSLGFMPSTDLVTMDISEEEKEGSLYVHSEKLALAYGILRTYPGKEVRISKNIRICSDCHNWIKLISKLLGRVIIVRDRIRFHHFESGTCSCGDYW